MASAAREQRKASNSDGDRIKYDRADAHPTMWPPSNREPAEIDARAIKLQRDEMTKLGRRAAEHGGTVNFEVSPVVDESVRGSLGHYPAVLEVVGQCGLRRTGR